ncbi:MAG TPA: hypothetical protein VIW46_07050 [Acidimicrobiia bacterium]
MRRAVAAALALSVAVACGGESDTIEGDLAAASEIVQIPASAAEPIKRDRYGFTSPSAEATIDVFDVDAAQASRFDVFTAPRGESIRFVRNPVSRGPLTGVLDAADSLVIVLIPLLDPTRDFGVEFDAFFIALDASGAVVASDYESSTNSRLDALFRLGRGAGLEAGEILAITAQAVNAENPSGIEAEALSILRG